MVMLKVLIVMLLLSLLYMSVVVTDVSSSDAVVNFFAHLIGSNNMVQHLPHIGRQLTCSD
jgi:hypothetical protein